LAAARGGDARALGEALESFRTYLLAVADRELEAGLRVKGAASDLVQDTFLGVQRDLSDFRGRSAEELRQWLRAILRNQLANHRRRYRETGKRSVGRELPIDPVVMEGRPDPSTNPGVAAILKERAEAIRSALGRLPERNRRVIVWHMYDGLSFAAVGERLGITAEAARKLWSRSLQRLRDELGPVHESH
jgi:RNA polymerase sigma-70 factor (ECF subfamily)